MQLYTARIYFSYLTSNGRRVDSVRDLAVVAENDSSAALNAWLDVFGRYRDARETATAHVQLRELGCYEIG
mgnify:CR=1 FL=1